MTTSTTVINLRASPDVRDLIDRAALVQGKTRTDFILEASSEAARQVLLDQTFFHLDDQQWQAFQAQLDQPIDANEAVMRLLSKPSPWEP